MRLILPLSYSKRSTRGLIDQPAEKPPISQRPPLPLIYRGAYLSGGAGSDPQRDFISPRI